MAVQIYGNVLASKTWSLQEQIDQMQGLVSLCAQDDKAFKAISNKELRDNEEKMAELRAVINITRTALSKVTPEDDRILKTAFRQYPFEYRVVRYKTSEEAKIYMDDKVLQLHRELEKLRVQKQHQESRIQELKNNLESAKQITISSSVEAQRQKIRELETEIKKIRIHLYAADLLSSRLEVITYLLKQDEYHYANLIDKLEKAAVHQSKELRDIKKVCIQALNLRDSLKENMYVIENETQHIKQERERLIKKLRKDIEKRGDVEIKKTVKPLEDYGDIAAIIAQRDADNALLESFKREADVLLEAAKVSDLKLFLPSWKMLLMGSRHLQDKLEKKEKLKEEFEIERDDLEELMLQLQYTDSNPDPKGLLKTELDEKLTEEGQQLWMTLRIKYQVGSLVQNLKLGLQNLMERVSIADLHPRYYYPTSDDDHVNNLKHCDAVLSQLLAQITEEGGEEGFQEIIQAQQASAKQEDLVLLEKSRIAKAEQPLVFEHEEAEAVAYGLTRDQVKAMSQALIDANTRKKRKKAKRRGRH